MTRGVPMDFRRRGTKASVSSSGAVELVWKLRAILSAMVPWSFQPMAALLTRASRLVVRGISGTAANSLGGRSRLAHRPYVLSTWLATLLTESSLATSRISSSTVPCNPLDWSSSIAMSPFSADRQPSSTCLLLSASSSPASSKPMPLFAEGRCQRSVFVST